MLGTHQVSGFRYLISPDHRNGNPHKAQWTISVAEEVACFERSVANSWLEQSVGWGLHVDGGSVSYLGTTANDFGPVEQSFVAFFQLASDCHGYPADVRRRTRERPSTRVRRAWLDGGYLRPAVVRKLSRGQRCAL